MGLFSGHERLLAAGKRATWASESPFCQDLEAVSLAEDEDSCCWVCQTWRETRLAYIPGISGPETSEVWVGMLRIQVEVLGSIAFELESIKTL